MAAGHNRPRRVVSLRAIARVPGIDSPERNNQHKPVWNGIFHAHGFSRYARHGRSVAARHVILSVMGAAWVGGAEENAHEYESLLALCRYRVDRHLHGDLFVASLLASGVLLLCVLLPPVHDLADRFLSVHM